MMSESYDKFIHLSNIERPMDLSENDIDLITSLLKREFVETQLEISIKIIEQSGMLNKFSEYVLENPKQFLWESIEKFVERYPEKFRKNIKC